MVDDLFLSLLVWFIDRFLRCDFSWRVSISVDSSEAHPFGLSELGALKLAFNSSNLALRDFHRLIRNKGVSACVEYSLHTNVADRHGLTCKDGIVLHLRVLGRQI